MGWKCEVSSCPRCALDVFEASSSVLRGGRRELPGGRKDSALLEHTTKMITIVHRRTTTYPAARSPSPPRASARRSPMSLRSSGRPVLRMMASPSSTCHLMAHCEQNSQHTCSR